MPNRAHAIYAAGCDEESALIARYGPLIDRAARRLSARTAGAIASEDLWSAGALGLLEAARRFDPVRDVRFETFADHRIKGAMLDEMRRLDHVPRRLRAKAGEVERARARLEHKLEREPTAEELSEEAQVSLDELSSLAAVTQPHLSLEDTLMAPIVPSDEQVERREQARALATAIATLPDRLQLVLSLHYVEGLTYREVAKILDVSEPRVCQLHGEALASLRDALSAR
ncbi:MAG TPA: FliA/WhiG family RNA polymerase sigma factor [Anaeromyxobacteraceae bacterium]|nr:FliA/WhiG family RNA polymerase sigma factor [Anaeromyxobacteraceae bacterium]